MNTYIRRVFVINICSFLYITFSIIRVIFWHKPNCISFEKYFAISRDIFGILQTPEIVRDLRRHLSSLISAENVNVEQLLWNVTLNKTYKDKSETWDNIISYVIWCIFSFFTQRRRIQFITLGKLHFVVIGNYVNSERWYGN